MVTNWMWLLNSVRGHMYTFPPSFSIVVRFMGEMV